MNSIISKLLIKEVKAFLKRLEADSCEMSEEEGMALIETFAHIPMGTGAALEYLNVSNGTFNTLMALGKIPKGKKRKYLKERYFYKDELDKAVKNIKERK